MAAGTALETLRRLELGRVVGMKIETLMRIAGALGVAPADLLPDLGCAVKPEAVPPKRRRVDPVLRVRPRPADVVSSSDSLHSGYVERVCACGWRNVAV